jgi:peroxiredoxin
MHSVLSVGKQFPDLTLPNHQQHLIKLSELASGFPLILSFYRGYW